ncbi:MAG: sulfate adenylyltransferase subunit CysN [Thermoanaerobaculia bacterium]
MSSVPASRERAVEEFLQQYGKRDLLRFLTCGSVDDGKSTLIGRLLHDSQMIYDDQLAAVKRASVKHGTTGGEIDLALLVDGLQAEREQGITIDVAYRYFSTSRRKFIIADTPGHEQYTRNMATGASTCNLAVILVDAEKGILPQTRRHSFISSLLGIRHLVVAVNKMDLVEYSESRFEEIRDAFTEFAAKLQVSDVYFIPMSALNGENVVHRGERMPWYEGSPLLDYLETVHIASDRNLIDFRLPVQLVTRPDSSFRGYAGTVASGIVRKGDDVVILPSKRRTKVASIHGVDGEVEEAFASLPVTVTLVDEVDVSRGDTLVHPNNVPKVDRELEAMVVWMHEAPLAPGREYLLKQTTVLTSARITALRYRMNVNSLHREAARELSLNEIGRVRLETPRLLAFDPYSKNRSTGAFILIDRITNATVAAGMILDLDATETSRGMEAPSRAAGAVTPEDRAARLRQRGVTIRTVGSREFAVDLERALFDLGYVAMLVEKATEARLLNRAGVIAIVEEEMPDAIVARETGDAKRGSDGKARRIAEELEREGKLR